MALLRWACFGCWLVLGCSGVRSYTCMLHGADHETVCRSIQFSHTDHPTLMRPRTSYAAAAARSLGYANFTRIMKSFYLRCFWLCTTSGVSPTFLFNTTLLVDARASEGDGRCCTAPDILILYGTSLVAHTGNFRTFARSVFVSDQWCFF